MATSIRNADEAQPQTIASRIARLDWGRIAADLESRGWANTGPILEDAECSRIAAWYDRDSLFRSRVVMARHGFGKGEYR